MTQSKGNNSKRIKARVVVFALCTSCYYICMKFRENSLNGFQVLERTRFCDSFVCAEDLRPS